VLVVLSLRLPQLQLLMVVCAQQGPVVSPARQVLGLLLVAAVTAPQQQPWCGWPLLPLLP
jgi:hypothetical protein